MITKHIKVYGRVQGVGFRFYTEQLAKQFNVTGTVQNVSDYVEIYVSGNPEKVSQFENKVITGASPMSDVKSYEINELPYKDYGKFKTI